MNSTLDEAEIRFLITRERYFRDTCDWTSFRNAYHPETYKTFVHVSWYKGDVDGFIKESQNIDTSSVSVVHRINPAVVHLNGSKALCESTGEITARFTASSGYEYDLLSYARFLSQLEKREGTWYMVSLEVIYVKDMIYPVGNAPGLDYSNMIEWPRSSYRFLAWHLEDRGVTPKTDLPGEDAPEMVEQLLQQRLIWLATFAI